VGVLRDTRNPDASPMIVQTVDSAPPRAAMNIVPDQVLRGEPFSALHLEQHARQLAASLVLARHPTKDGQFASRFEDNASFLYVAYEAVAAAVREGGPLTPEAEWLLDNFYVVEEQLREIRDDLPQRFYRELPKLTTGQARVYALALELIVHTDSALDEETIVRFLHEFQAVAPLSIGEVWAVPIMLRLGLVENLRRLAGQMVSTRRCQEEARRLVAAWREHEPFPIDFSSLQACAPLVLQLLDEMQQARAAKPAGLKRLEDQLAEYQLDALEIARIEHQRQAANQVSIGNVITSMRLISALDWVVFFERTNLAEEALRQDPAEVYPRMDFESRDRYRHAVEQLAKRTKLSDVEVAAHAVSLARKAEAAAGEEWQQRHVGYWLVDRGRSELERQLGYRPSFRERATRWLLAHPNAAFFGSVVFLSALLDVPLVLGARLLGVPDWIATAMAAIFLIPASELAVSLTNLIVTCWLPPRLLPKLEFKDGVPATYTTFVVMPTLLTSVREVDTLLSRIEMHYLANPEPALKFALLTDFADADAERLPGDEELVHHAVRGIQSLNERYNNDGPGPFYLFHRSRRWNPSENRWMGWERKRGKLMEFNRWLRGASDTSFVVQEGDVSSLVRECEKGAIQFVITLDADTQLPFGAARRLIGTLAHPLNRPHFDPVTRRLSSGYSVLQPRVSVHLASANRSWYSRICANSPGIDPYTTCASDVYQDLFGEGSFTGKGIYDLDAFERSLNGAFPENQILSHDLIEGCHSRVALVTDIEFIDSHPSRYDVAARRLHRWVRGDWQILPWLFPRVPADGGWRNNPLSLLSKWKIFDNLRRSLVPPGLMAFFIVGWLLWPAAAWLWTLCGLVVLGFPLLAQIALAVRHWPRAVTKPHHLRALAHDLGRSLLQIGLVTVFLVHEAVLMLDAIGRTTFRMVVTRRRLLEWETADATERRLRQSRWSALLHLWYVPLICAFIAIFLRWPALLAASPLLAAWFLSPLVAHLVSLPFRQHDRTIESSQEQWLRLLARKTWMFYEAYVGQEDHWLPPDNMQEYPSEKIAHRVSPTNVGLYMASALAARDFGYVGIHDLAERWERTLATLAQLDRLHGHFFNWYDTLTLQALFPRYVSTVDSGNLVACLLTMQQGIAELRAAPILPANHWQGLLDTIAAAEEACENLHPPGARLVNTSLSDLANAITNLRRTSDIPPRNSLEWQAKLQALTDDAELLKKRLTVFQMASGLPSGDVAAKVRSLLRWVQETSYDSQTLLPWVPVIAEACKHPQGRAPTSDEAPLLPWGHASDEFQQICRAAWTRLANCQSLGAATELEKIVSGELATLKQQFASLPSATDRAAATAWADTLIEAVASSKTALTALDHRYASIAKQMESLALEMDFRFLFNSQRRLFSIGYNVEDGKLDRSHYDMLCSEARLASYLAIAKGEVEPRHWFQLGRLLTETAGQLSLLSWGGTMFEYLMPPVFQRDYEGSLLWQSCRAAVARQQQYGRQNGVAWGISESAFGALAVNSDYHYRSFGVPGLGLKRGLGKDLVVSPYSTMLALEIDPAAAYENLQLLVREGALGQWGFYEAVDYTPQRVPTGKRSIIVRCYMAHHQGMSLLALANLLFAGCIRRRFHAHPLPRSTELLLQERVPIAAPRIEPHADEVALIDLPRFEDEFVSRRLTGVDTRAPRTHLLANGQYSVMLSSTGGGYSRWRDIAVTRWRPDTTRDNWGQFIYLRDLGSHRVWSATYQPTCAAPDKYEVIYSIDKAEFHRRDGDIETRLEVAVSPENNAEVRQLQITNHSSHRREIEITSYVEIALNSQLADLTHPAFHKLFLETEYIREETALLVRRRPRDSRQQPLWALHVLSTSGSDDDSVEYESSRQAFIGRGRTSQSPAALDAGARLSGQIGAVLDPILALRCVVSIRPHASVTIGLTTAVATSREEALTLADQYHEIRSVQRAFELAWAYNQVQLRHLHLSPAKAHLYQRMASAIVYPDPLRRGSLEMMRDNRQGQSGLWRHGISGDLPIVLIHVTKPEHVGHVRELLAAHAYWQSHGLSVDLTILNDYPGSYLDALHEQLIALLNEVPRKADQPQGGVFLLRGAQLQREDKALLEIAASVVLQGEQGTIAKQWDAALAPKKLPARAAPKVADSSAVYPTPSAAKSPPTRSYQPLAASSNHANNRATQNQISQLEFWNGVGGFADGGREYRILIKGGQLPTTPWSNVIANPSFGTLVTESGGGFTWHVNSRENKLSPWSNDSVSDPPGEILYLRDEETGELWSPTPLPLRDQGDYQVHHGQGYTRLLHDAGGIDQEILVSIAAEDPVKFVVLKLRNTSGRPRQLSVTYFADLVLGVCREQTQLYLETLRHEPSGALLARNTFHPDLPHQVAFLHVLGESRSITADRTDFIGRNNDLTYPQGLRTSSPLSGRTGLGLDPCGAVQTRVRLAPGAQTEVIFLLGAGTDGVHADALLSRYSDASAVKKACDDNIARWESILSSVQVKTPSRAFDLLINRWLLYQTLSCRVWGRSSFYQSGGAYGFRDQLQDVMALVYSRPDVARKHLLRAASRQFEEGDVQHWWHPPSGRGTRTRFSDDYLWLPFAVSHYVRTTGDATVLDEELPFLNSPPLDAKEHERYETPAVSSVHATLYEHCRRAILHGFRTGPHGLPLMGCGDWNDGMNRVGEHGQGESVWVGWFLLVVLRDFIPHMLLRGDAAARDFQSRADALRLAIEEHAWDGQWYRRAYFDDGTPLGSAQNDECQIDSIAQTWAVLADAQPQRTAQAMQAVLDRLVRFDEGLVLLFAPPFDKTPLDPGYIKGYLPGIRENGGQYTHPALWVIQALAKMGRPEEAMKVFDLINPIHHTRSAQAAAKYQVEPYVVAADVYGVPPHVGRGGWTWYTGSAAWMYRVALESLLGFELRGNRVKIKPCVPADWPGFELTFRRGVTTWKFIVDCHAESQTPTEFELVDDGQPHETRVSCGKCTAVRA
jgi:cyclic beta-1,2-glucan synthetase